MTAAPRRRNIRIGAVSLLALAALFAVGVVIQKSRARAESLAVAEADRRVAAGLRGECGAFREAQGIYYRAMRRHLQNRNLLGRATLAADLARECEDKTAADALAAREQLLAAGRFTFDDVKRAAVGRLARGDRAGALAALAKLPNDEFCRWFAAWIRSLPEK